MKIYHTRGVYPNNSFKDNGVRPEHIEHHKQYNETFRPGRALLVDGVCVYRGSLSDEQIARHESRMKDDMRARALTRYSDKYQ